MTDVEYTALKAEITTDPLGLGYPIGNDPGVADMLNQIGLSSETIDREVIDGQELQKCVVISEYMALAQVARDGWIAIISAGSGQVDPVDTRVRNQIKAIWGLGTSTRVNLLALSIRPCSRVEKLFGINISVSHIDVANALLYY